MKNSRGLHITCVGKINLCKNCIIQALKNNWEIIKRITKV